jgi:hypothetical protein
MVILGGLELVAAGYLINRHQKNKQEARRIQEEEDLLEEQRYRIYSANNAGPGRRRNHSHDRKHSHSHHRRHSHDRRHSRDDRRDDRKHNYERPQKQRPHASSAPPMYAATAPVIHQAMRPAAPAVRPAPAMAPVRPPAPSTFPVTGWPANWEQSQRAPVGPQPQTEQLPPNLAPYYRDPAQADVKYGFHDEEDGDRGRAQLRPEDAHSGHGGRSRSSRGSSTRNVRFDVSNQRQPGDEPPPAYRL